MFGMLVMVPIYLGNVSCATFKAANLRVQIKHSLVAAIKRGH
jgi:hypothetical protein